MTSKLHNSWQEFFKSPLLQHTLISYTLLSLYFKMTTFSSGRCGSLFCTERPNLNSVIKWALWSHSLINEVFLVWHNHSVFFQWLPLHICRECFTELFFECFQHHFWWEKSKKSGSVCSCVHVWFSWASQWEPAWRRCASISDSVRLKVCSPPSRKLLLTLFQKLLLLWLLQWQMPLWHHNTHWNMYRNNINSVVWFLFPLQKRCKFKIICIWCVHFNHRTATSSAC